MKIRLYALHLGYGGVENYVTTVANVLSISNEVEIVSTYKTSPNPAFRLKENVKVTYLTDGFPRKEKGLSFFRYILPSAVLFIKKYYKNIISISRCDADVIISTRIFHNRLIRRFAKKGIYKITGEHNHHQNKKSYIRRVIRSLRGFDLFIPISRELCDFYKPLLEKRGTKVLHLPFCIEAQDLSNVKKEKHLIYAGRFSREKGVPDTIDVFEKVLKNLPDCRLHLIGDGEEREKIERLIAEKKLEKYISLYGYKDREFVIELMKKCSAYIMTSYTESFGIALLEAMSCGLFCAAFSDAAGASEIITNGHDGYIIKNRDKDQMARALCEALTSDEKLKELSLNAIKTAEGYSDDKMAEGWQRVTAQISRPPEEYKLSALERRLKKAFTD